MFHYVFRKRFLEISVDPRRGGGARASRCGFWDFLFYASFGFVVTRSVAIAGVLLVFCYLIVPSVAGMLFSTRIGPRLAIGWAMAARRFDAGHVFFGGLRPAHRGDDRVHVRRRAGPDGSREGDAGVGRWPQSFSTN